MALTAAAGAMQGNQLPLQSPEVFLDQLSVLQKHCKVAVLWYC